MLLIRRSDLLLSFDFVFGTPCPHQESITLAGYIFIQCSALCLRKVSPIIVIDEVDKQRACQVSLSCYKHMLQ
jgi:hypothetical protein